jgi:hypothetical protein
VDKVCKIALLVKNSVGQKSGKMWKIQKRALQFPDG